MWYLALLLLARVVIAVQLTRVALRQKLPNLFWLAAFFAITALGDVYFSTVAMATGIFWPFGLSIGLGDIVLVLFIQKTFYQDRKSPWLVFLGVAVIVAVMDVIRPFPFFSPLTWLWLIVVGYQAYRQIAADKAVEDWVKARYLLVVAYSIIALSGPFLSVSGYLAAAVPALTPYVTGPTAQMVNAVLTVIGIAVQYLAWVMPEFFRRFLNRKYQAPALGSALGMSEEEVLRQFQP